MAEAGEFPGAVVDDAIIDPRWPARASPSGSRRASPAWRRARAARSGRSIWWCGHRSAGAPDCNRATSQHGPGGGVMRQQGRVPAADRGAANRWPPARMPVIRAKLSNALRASSTAISTGEGGVAAPHGAGKQVRGVSPASRAGTPAPPTGMQTSKSSPATCNPNRHTKRGRVHTFSPRIPRKLHIKRGAGSKVPLYRDKICIFLGLNYARLQKAMETTG